MDRFVDAFASALGSGASLEEAHHQLRSHGASPVQTIVAIIVVRGASLGEAKDIFSNSPAWAREVQAGVELHKQIVSGLSSEAGRQS